MTTDLAGRTALVTGASTGIGRGIAMHLARCGVRVIAVARRTALLQELLDELPPGPGHRAVTADLATEEGILAASNAVESADVDIVVNNAGVSAPVPVGGPERLWQETFTLQFHAPRRLSEAALPAMRVRGFGRILMIGGTLEPGEVPNASSAAKAALVVYAKALANAVAADGVTVNTIVPGRITSEQVLTRLHPDPSERAAFAATHIPARRFGDPEDVAHLAAFLASSAASYLTGAVIPIDGGMRRYAF